MSKLPIGTIILPNEMTKRQVDQFKNKPDIRGMKVGRLTVIELAYAKAYKGFYYLCKCDCGKECYVLRTLLTSKKTQSCGCLNKEALLQHSRNQGKEKMIDGILMSKHPLYKKYHHMLKRVYHPTTKSDKERYMNRGITVCDEWLGENGFMNFYQWAISNGWNNERLPSGMPVLSLDRVDNNKGYSPDNCRWADWKTQRANQERYKAKHDS